MRRQIACVAVLGIAGAAIAATVTVNAPAGTETNVYAFVKGEDALAVNTGATGGVVHLSPYSSHTGGTTLGSGTLVLTKPVDAEETTGELGAGPFVQEGGTLRYAGPAGTWTRAITNTASAATAAVVWQVENDLTMDCDVAQTVGAFVKTGLGTLTFPQPFAFGGATAMADATRRSLMDLSPDRAPTQGYSNFTLVDGTVVIDTDPGSTEIAGAVTNVLNANGICTIGACTTTNGTETTGVLEHRSGITRTASSLTIGFCNGSVHNSAEALSPTLRVTGGRFLVGPAGANALYMGVNQGVADFTGQRSAPRLEVASAQRMMCKGINIAHTPGANSTVIVRDGGYLYGLDSHFYVGNYETFANPQPTTNYVEVTGAGSWLSFQNFYNDNKNNGMVTTFRIADGGTVEMRNFVNREGGELHLVVDGGVWRHRNNNNATPHIPSSMTSVKVGPGGFITYFNDGDEAYPVIFEKGIEPLDDSGTDGGLHVTRGSGAMPPLRLNAVNTYCGPTEISFTRVYLGKQGRLPSGTALSVHGNNGGLIITNGVQTVGSFTFGSGTSSNSPILGFGPGSRLDVTGELEANGCLGAPKLHLFETEGGTAGLSSLGTYTYVTARAEDEDELVRMAERFTFTYKPDTVVYTCFVERQGDRALLKVAVTPAGTAATRPGDPLVVVAAEGETETPSAEAVAAARAIYTNPSFTGYWGTVDLGALEGFAAGGTLRADNGFTRVTDLSFMQSETNLVLGMGTFVYAGESAEIPGFTVDTMSNRSSVFSVAETNTTLTIRSINAVQGKGSVSKMGPGALHLAGTGEILLPRNAVDNGNYNGMTADGIGPGTGFRYFNVNEGRLVIGTVGDPADAPHVVSIGDFSVGSQSHRTGQGVQTAGELVMNNGVLDVGSYFYLGYYSGRYDDCPDIVTHPTITQNGGEISYTTLRMGHGNASHLQTASPNLFIHAGTNTCRGAAAIGYSVVPVANRYRATVVIDGTGVMRVGGELGLGWVDKAAGADLTVTGNGRLEVDDTLSLARKNTREVNTFRLTGNGVVCARNITGNSAAFAYPVDAWFDGGTVESLVNTSDNSVFRYLRHAYLGARGLTFDLSHQAELAGPTTYWLLVQQAFEPDPDLGETPDGGLTFTGAGTVSLGAGFENSTFTGGIRLRDGARAVIANGYSADFALDVGPGARLFDYDGAANVVKDLTLGSAGATEPVVIEIERETGSYGIVATNSLAILSPVAVTTHAGMHDFETRVVAGVYTALVYSASNADVDLTKFVLPAEAAQTATLVAEQVTVADGGDYNGMKAVVVTIAGASGGRANGNTWKSVTAGGAWSEVANWENAAAGAPNGARKEAYFHPATKAGVPVTLDEAVTLGNLTLNAGGKTYGYTLSGQQLTLDDGDATAVLVNAGGTNTIASALAVAGTAQAQTAAGNELRLAGGVTGDGTLELNTHAATGGGQVNLTIGSGFTGKVKTGCGRVVVDDLSSLSSADQLTIGPGTLLYTGSDAEIPGLSFGAGTGRAGIIEHTADLTVNALEIDGTSAFLKLGSGTMRLHGTGTFAPNTTSNRVSSTQGRGANGDAPRSATMPFAVGRGTFVLGELDDPANAPTISFGTAAIGAPTTTGNVTFELNNGVCAATGEFYLGYYAPNNTYTLTYRQNGGELRVGSSFQTPYWLKSKQKTHTLVEINGGTVWVKKQLYLGRSTATSPSSQINRFVMNGGSFATEGNMHFAYSNSTNKAYVDLNGGILTCSNTLYAAYKSGNDVTVRLNPNGMFRCNAYAATVGNSVTRFYGNGGAFRPLCRAAAAQTMAADVFTHLYASTNGLVVDTSETLNGASFTMEQAILHDPDCAAADGGLVKRGAGTLTLAGANTYTGMTAVEGGILALSGAGTLGTGAGLAVADGAICDLGGTEQAAGAVAASGLVRNGALTVTEALSVGESVLSVDGDLALAVTATLDFAGRPELNLLAGEPVAVVSGAASLPKTAPAANAGDVKRVVFFRDGAVVYALAAPGGTVLIFR